MTAIEQIKKIKQMEFFERDCTLEQFVAEWEIRLFSFMHGNLPLEARAQNLLNSFAGLGYLPKEGLK